MELNQSKFTAEQQAILLKGFANQILQMNMPNFGHLQKFLEEFEIQTEVSGKFQYTHDEIHRAILMCVMIGKGLRKKESQNYGERASEILLYALNYDEAHKAVIAMAQKPWQEDIFGLD